MYPFFFNHSLLANMPAVANPLKRAAESAFDVLPKKRIVEVDSKKESKNFSQEASDNNTNNHERSPHNPSATPSQKSENVVLDVNTRRSESVSGRKDSEVSVIKERCSSNTESTLELKTKRVEKVEEGALDLTVKPAVCAKIEESDRKSLKDIRESDNDDEKPNTKPSTNEHIPKSSNQKSEATDSYEKVIRNGFENAHSVLYSTM